MKAWILLFISAVGALAFSQPGYARRVVVDGNSAGNPVTLSVFGYCSLDGLDCGPRNLGFTVRIGGVDYSQFVAHGNGLLSLGSAADFTKATGNLADYGIPVFSPLINNSIAPLFGEHIYVASASTTAGTLRVNWFACPFTYQCGTFSPIDLTSSVPADEQRDKFYRNMFSMILTKLDDGFQVDFSYYPRRDYPYPLPGENPSINSYGFSLPGVAEFQTTGPIQNQSFRFDSEGRPLTAVVPEPSAWLMLLAGFGILGSALRYRRHERARVAVRAGPLAPAL